MNDHEHNYFISQNKNYEKIMVETLKLQVMNTYVTI